MAPRKLVTLLRIGHGGRLLVAEAAVRLAMARLALALFPFQRVACRRGRLVPPDDDRARDAGESGEATAAAARKVGWAVRAVAPSMPFKALCLQQALAAHAMLRRRGIEAPIHFGAGRDESDRFEAHAWLKVAGVEVTGYPIPARMREIGCVVSDRIGP
jgi:hypothetical protein